MTENHKRWLTWVIMSLVTLAIALFFGVQYPMPEQPDEPPEPIALAANFSNPVDIEGSSSAAAPALTFEDDTDSGIFRSAADTLNIATGGTERLEIDGSGFTVVPPLDIDGAADFASTLDIAGTTTFAGVVSQTIGTENVGAFPTVLSASIVTDTDGALWTIADGEIWFVWNVFCNVTTNFDCTGDDCILHIGDGGDEDGFLDLDDGELQASDTEITGAEAGWQGLYTDTTGAYLAGNTMTGFIYAPSGAAETIDIKIEDSSDNSDPTAGAATCYLVYTRLQ